MKKHYQKYCMHLAYAIISTSTFLFTTRTFSQEKLNITPEFSKQIIEKYQVEPFKIYPVTIKEVDFKASDTTSKKSMIHVMSDNPVEINLLSGDFIKLPDYYILVSKEVENKLIKNELITEKNDYFTTLKGDLNRFPIIKKLSTNELFYVMSNRFIGQLEVEIDHYNFKNMGNSTEYKTWKSKYLALLQSAQTNVNNCNVIINKHTYLNRLGQKRYDSEKFTKQEKLTFNKNLDSLNEKLKTIDDLEDKRDFLSFYNDKISTVEATKSYALSNFYNNTSKSY